MNEPIRELINEVIDQITSGVNLDREIDRYDIRRDQVFSFGICALSSVRIARVCVGHGDVKWRELSPSEYAHLACIACICLFKVGLWRV